MNYISVCLVVLFFNLVLDRPLTFKMEIGSLVIKFIQYYLDAIT